MRNVSKLVSPEEIQSRKHQVGQVIRVPAPEIEAILERFVRGRAVDPRGDVRQLIKAQIDKITIQDASLEVELVDRDNGEPAADPRSRQIVSLPWSKRPSSAVKGVMSTPPTAAPADTKANAAILAGIAKAKRWVDALIDGASLPEIAKQEGKGERQIRLLIPLAFIPPNK